MYQHGSVAPLFSEKPLDFLRAIASLFMGLYHWVIEPLDEEVERRKRMTPEQAKEFERDDAW